MVEEHLVEEQTISIGEIFLIIKKHLLFLIIITLTFALALGVYAFQIATPKYRYSVEVTIAIIKDDESQTAEANRRITYAMTYVKGKTVASMVKEELALEGYDLSINEIMANTKVTSDANSLMFTVSYTSVDPKAAIRIADSLVHNLKLAGSDPTSSAYPNLNGAVHTDLDPEPKAQYVSPNKPLLVLVGALVGGVVGLVIVFVLEMVTSGYKTKEELERATNIIVLGVIPEFEGEVEVK